ncbi:MAG: MFS transporter [Candidatus Aenigmarchaeota archaeon]|nr:MFS transporter [Candidatus Aenigmarchaeota archaeon]
MRVEETKKLESNIKKFYLFQILLGMMFYFPILVLFWQSNGLSLTEVMILQSIVSISMVIFEIPTGYFADVFGRKKSFISAGFFLAMSIFVYCFSYNFHHFLVCELLWMIGFALISGADSAFLYDTLAALKKENQYKKIFGKARFYYLLAISGASIIGGFIGKINFRWTFYAMLPFVILLIPLSFSFTEPRKHNQVFRGTNLSRLIDILKYSFKNRKIKWLMIYSAIIFTFNGTAQWLYQPYFKLTGLDILYFGFVFAAFNLVAALSSKYAHAIEEKIGQKYSLVMLVFLMVTSYLLMGNFVFLFSFSFAFLNEIVFGFSKPIITDYINKIVSSDARATILSAQSMVGRLLYAAILPLAGWLADIYTLPQALSILGITTFVAGIIILVILHIERII